RRAATESVSRETYVEWRGLHAGYNKDTRGDTPPLIGSLERWQMKDVPRARALVLRYGWNATAYQIVNPGIDHWFSARGDAVIGFVRHYGVRVVAGAPVCDNARLPEVVAEWEQEAAGEGNGVCYFGAAGRVQSLLEGAAG